MKLNWGIVGLGKIAHKFVEDLQLVEDNVVYGVASRSLDKALDFKNKFKAEKAFDSYKALFEDPNIDIVYIATPHDSHALYSIEAMEHGKHVLCEKPAGINQIEVQSILQSSIQNNVFFMEAMWTRFNPTIENILKRLEANELGKLNHISADFSFHQAYDKSSRLFNINRGGGALLDIGIYPVFLSYLIFGTPKNINANAILDPTGIDLQVNAILVYENSSSSIYCSLLSPLKADAYLSGEKGRFHLESRWHESNALIIVKDEIQKKIKYPKTGRGYYHEIVECNSCLAKNQIQSNKWSHKNSIELISILDQIRTQCGIRYPMD